VSLVVSLTDTYLNSILINDGGVKGFIIRIDDFINDSGMMRIFQSVISLQILIHFLFLFCNFRISSVVRPVACAI